MQRLQSRALPACVFWLCAGLLWPQSDDPAALFQRAIQLQQAEDYGGAEQAYRAFLRIRPDEMGALSNLGVVLGKLGRYDEAIAEYEAAEKLAPNNPGLALNIALAYSKSGRLAAAAEKLERLHSTLPQDSRVTLLLADTRLQLGQDQAVIDLLKPLEGGGDLAVAYMLGTALLHTKRIDEGQVQLDKILSRGDSAEARFLLGTRMFESGDYPAAVKQLESAVAVNPNLPELQSLYGQALLFTGDADGASRAFEKELANNRNDYRANLGVGEILCARKQFKASLPYLRQAVLVRPQAAEAHRSLGEVFQGLNRSAEARQEAETAQRLGGNSVAQVEAKKPDQDLPLNALAPDFSLPNASGDKTIRLSAFRGKSPVVLVFGSYSCPNFRDAAQALEALHSKYSQHVPFLLVYIREAHTEQNWESTRNARDGIAMRPASTLAEKRDDAVMCSRKLHLRFPAVVDNLDGAVQDAYAAWPSRAVIVGIDGKMLYTSRLTELDFKAEEMESSLLRALAAKH